MKKRLIIITFILFFTCTIQVFATSIFKYDWKTNSEYLNAEYTMYYNNNIYFKRGYITTTINLEDQDTNGIPKTYINRYNIQGELENTKILNNKMIVSLTKNDQYIIALSITYNSSSNTYKILLMDETLNIKKEITINITSDEELENVMEEFKILGIEYLKVLDNKLYFLTSDYIKEINLESGTTNNIEVTDNNINTYLNHLFRLEEENTDTRYFIGYDKKNNYEVITGMENQGCNIGPVSQEVGGLIEDSLFSRYPIFSDAYIKQYASCEPNYKGVIKLYNNEQLVFEKIYEEYSTFSTPYIINDYIVTIAVKIDTDNYDFIVSIVILDKEGNILQEISEEEYYINLIDAPASFMTIGTNISSNNKCYTEEKSTSYNCFKNNNIVYYLPLNITTKVEGMGKIEVTQTARYEELVKYHPLPNKNYSLDSITILDSNNKEIIPNDNTFTMPNSDVTILATFAVTNPETNTSSIIIFIIILSLSILIFIRYRKKLKEE